MPVRSVESLVLQIEDPRYVESGADVPAAAHAYEASVYGTVRLLVDGEAVTHRNHLTVDLDLLDTARAQHELVRALERRGEYEGVPVCCTCGNRGCAYVEWDVESVARDRLRLAIRDLGGAVVGDSPYEVARAVLYAAARDFVGDVVAFCEAEGLDEFEWAEWKDPPVGGRERYATLEGLRGCRADLAASIEATGGDA